MLRYLPLLVAITVGLTCPSQPFTAENPNAPRTIVVNGDAEIRVVPNEVILTVGVESFDLDLKAAKADNDKRVLALMEVTRSSGIPKERVKVDFLSVSPVYDGNHAYEKLEGYVVRKTIVITLSEVRKFEALLSSAVGAGVNYVHGVDFRTTELRLHRDKARALALQAAREKADAMARQLGQVVSVPLTIQEGYGGWWSSYGSWWGGSRGGGMAQNVMVSESPSGSQMDGPTAPGEISVTAHVTVTFQLGA